MINPLRNLPLVLPEIGLVGDFGYRRSFYHHSGIDLYAQEGQEIQAIEDGVVVHIESFTGPNAEPPSPWWLETWSILIEGKSGVLGYCEIKPMPHIKVGISIKEGELIATVVPVLKKNKGNGTTMLHFEHYESGTKHHVTWLLDTIKPEELKDSRLLLECIMAIK